MWGICEAGKAILTIDVKYLFDLRRCRRTSWRQDQVIPTSAGPRTEWDLSGPDDYLMITPRAKLNKVGTSVLGPTDYHQNNINVSVLGPGDDK